MFIEAAADTATFFPIPVDEILDGSAVGDVALAAAGHQKFRAGAACFLQDQASRTVFGRAAGRTGAAMRGAACWDGEAAPAWRPPAAVSNLAPANRPDAPAPTIMQS